MVAPIHVYSINNCMISHCCRSADSLGMPPRTGRDTGIAQGDNAKRPKPADIPVQPDPRNHTTYRCAEHTVAIPSHFAGTARFVPLAPTSPRKTGI